MFAAVVLLALHPDEQPRSGHLSADLPVVGLLWPGCGVWPARSLLWHAHSLLYGSRGGSVDSRGPAPTNLWVQAAHSRPLLLSLVSAGHCSYGTRHHEVSLFKSPSTCTCACTLQRSSRSGELMTDYSFRIRAIARTSSYVVISPSERCLRGSIHSSL